MFSLKYTLPGSSFEKRKCWYFLMLGNLLKYSPRNVDHLYAGTITLPSCVPTSYALLIPMVLEQSTNLANS